MAEFVGDSAAAGKRWAIVVARFNSSITERLLQGAQAELKKLGADEAQVDVIRVPGSFEIPVAARTAAASGRYAGVVCCGAIIKGQTSHNEHIASACVAGMREASEVTGVPVALGVITANSFDQASERARLDGGRNLGADAAAAAVEMASMLGKLSRGP